MATVRTRFAPSPTGNLHIGGARTALYSYLWAKKNNGQFFLRIEDTDRTRYQAGAEQSIYEGLQWIGLSWEDHVIKQSTRTEVYRQHAQQLVQAGKAYYCFCTAERLDLMREIQQKKGRAPKYDKTCLHLSADEIQTKLDHNEPHVIRLNIPAEGSVRVNDLVRGAIDFKCEELDDQILLKSDGYPTYHLAVVVDDHELDITHVIRGEEWIPSTPKHVLLYQAFGWEAPTFAHLSLFINKGGGKLSKREGATSLLEYRNQGYLPEAVVNFIAFLGWNPKSTEEFFSIDQLAEVFELTQINTANPIFDTEKLDWYNGQYIRKLPIETLVQLCQPYLPTAELEYLKAVVGLEQDRLKKLTDIKELTSFFFTDELNYDSSLLVWKKSTPELTKQSLEKLVGFIETVGDWTAASLETAVLSWIQSQGLQNGDVLWPMRAALSGQKASPPPFAIAAVLGKTRTVQRLQLALARLS
jgi:glutamyl-tRNA synthetase